MSLMRGMLLVLVGVIAPTSFAAQAQPANALEALLGSGARPYPQPLTAPTAIDPAFSPERARAAAAARRAAAAVARKPRAGQEKYTRLPATPSAPAPLRAVPRGEILDTEGALAAIMADPTLRPGDVVMFPDGPRVFNGQSRDRHTARSFDPAGSSRLVSAQTRTQLTSLGAKPARTEKVVKLRKPMMQSTVAVQGDERTSPRVVYRDTRGRI